jgi:hypothetical protein
MSNHRSLSADEFEQMRRGPSRAAFWRARMPLENPIGPFEIELDAPPDAELLAIANELIAVVSTQHAAIVKLIYANYLEAAEDRWWMKSCGVPRKLEEDQVLEYLRSRSISVRRDGKGRISGSIYFSPKWDIEHGIYLGLANGHVVPNPY